MLHFYPSITDQCTYTRVQNSSVYPLYMYINRHTQYTQDTRLQVFVSCDSKPDKRVAAQPIGSFQEIGASREGLKACFVAHKKINRAEYAIRFP